MGDFQEAPGAPAAQRGLGVLLGRLRPPDLLGLANRRRRDRLYRPLPPPDLEAREARQAPRNQSQPPKLSVITKTENKNIFCITQSSQLRDCVGSWVGVKF